MEIMLDKREVMCLIGPFCRAMFVTHDSSKDTAVNDPESRRLMPRTKARLSLT